MTDALPPRGHVPATPCAIMRARIRMTTGERMSVLRISTAIVAIAIGATFALSACAPIIVAGAAAGAALIATDRRSAGAQVDDQAIETKAGARAGAQWGERIHLNVTSYNGSVQNEMVVAPITAMSSRTNDTYITSKVKARFVEENRFPANLVKVVTERQVVYLMGIVTHREACLLYTSDAAD